MGFFDISADCVLYSYREGEWSFKTYNFTMRKEGAIWHGLSVNHVMVPELILAR